MSQRTKREITERVNRLVLMCLGNMRGYTETEEDEEEVLAQSIIDDWWKAERRGRPRGARAARYWR